MYMPVLRSYVCDHAASHRISVFALNSSV